MQQQMRPAPSKELVEQMIEEAKALGEVPYQQNGTMDFDYFVKTQKIATKYIYLYSKDGLEEDKAKRRQFVKDDKEREFINLVMLNMTWQEKTNGFMKMMLYKALKVPQDVLGKTGQMYMADEANRVSFVRSLNEMRDELKGGEMRQLTKEQCLAYVRKIEDSKYESIQELHKLHAEKKITPNNVKNFVKCSKIKAHDKLFNEDGIEQEDMNRAFSKLEL